MLKGKVAIVGGASKGLGRACAQALADEGANLAICSRSEPDLEKAAREIRQSTGVEVLAFAGDLDNNDTIRILVAATVDRFGRLDVLVNNSGGPPLAALLRAHVAGSAAAPEEERRRTDHQHPGEPRLSAHRQYRALRRDPH